MKPGIRLINFNKLSAEEGKLLASKGQKKKIAIIPCSNNVFQSNVPLDMSFVSAIQNYLKDTHQEGVFYQRRTPRMTAQLDENERIIPQIMEKDILLSYPFESIKPFIRLLNEAAENGKEAAEVFAALLCGEVVKETNTLLVAPECLQNKVLDMIEEEIAYVKNGEEGYIGIKINSLTDKVIIDKLIEASKAGVKIEMIIRGICCLLPGVKKYTENMKVPKDRQR